MSATASRLRKYWIEGLVALFVVANVVAIIVVSDAHTVPFHFVWIVLTVTYGLRHWPLASTLVVFCLATLATGVALTSTILEGAAGFPELAEVPLMAVIFLVMVWHVEYRQAKLQQSEQRELRLQDERGFVQDASHQLRTPITVAKGHAELIRAAYPGEQGARDAEIVLEELNRLTKISERLLILASAERAFLQLRPVELERLIVATARRWAAAAPREWYIDAAVQGTLLADEDRLTACVDALVENAVKFTDPGDRIAIIGREERGQAVIEISDSGVGIPRASLSMIFDRFSRGQGTADRQDGGAGLGLAIVKAITEAHGGLVDVASEVGKGTSFVIYLPGLMPRDDGDGRSQLDIHELDRTAATT